MLRRLRWLPVSLLLGCLDSFAPAGAAPFNPPASYRAWWAAMEACAATTGDFDRVAWYAVEGSSYPCPAYDGRCEGWWQPPHTVYIAQPLIGDRLLVEHEMLHDLLERGDHPPLFQACGV